jgi:hypothetical protein
MAAGKYNFIVEQGSQHEVSFVYKDSSDTAINLDGKRVRMAVKDHITDTEFVYRATSDSTADTGYADHFDIPTQTGSDIGKFVLTIPSSITDDFTFNQGVYDLELVTTATNVVERIIEGKFKVKPQVTD